MDYEPEKMTVEMMKRMIFDAYNDVTFKNALVCILDWCNYQHCVNIHKDTRIGVDQDGNRIEKYTQVKYNDLYQLTTDTTIDISKQYFSYDSTNKKYDKVWGGSGVNPQEQGWYEYVNPQSKSWYEKVKTMTEYSKVKDSQKSYWDSPFLNQWYVHNGLTYELTNDRHCVGTFVAISNPSAGVSPRDNNWYEYNGFRYESVVYYDPSANPNAENWYVNTGTEQSPVYTRTTDTTVQEGTTYYLKVEDYVPTTDNNVVDGKTYYICSYKDYYSQITRSVKLYEHTTDTVVIEGKTYYTEKGVDHWLPEDPDAWDYTKRYSRHIDITVPGVSNEITLQNRRPLPLP